MNKITDQIWIGNSQDAKNAEALRAQGIRNILNVAEDLPAALTWKDGFTHYHVGICDGPNEPELYEGALQVLRFITKDSGRKVLVHCHEGRSRSVFITAAHLVKHCNHFNLTTAIDHIAACGRPVAVHNGHPESFPPSLYQP